MKTIWMPFLFFCQIGLSFQGNLNKTKLIEAQSGNLAKFIVSESLDGLQTVFAMDAWILPEYHKTLVGVEDIESYYGQFFEKSVTLSYQKHPFEIQEFGGAFLELGTFKHRYQTPEGTLFDYNGKYMTFWEFKGDTPKINAHIWGASNYFEAENLTFVSMDPQEIKVDIPKSEWKDAIEEVRSYVYQAVLHSDAKTTMKSYAEDAIYMTYYDPPFLGKTQIANYFYPHYQPGTVQRDSLMTRAVRIIDLGKYALKFGEYHVEWTYEDQPYFIKGKGISLFRRREDGEVEIYRQMINHSMPPTPKE